MNEISAGVMQGQLLPIVESQPYPLLFVTISGAHLYGFPSPDSDYDLRGVHVLPLRGVIGLNEAQDTVELSGRQNGIELDLVTHDVRKFIDLLLKPNGYVLEQLYSPLVVSSTPEHDDLKALATGCIMRRHANHYLGFATSQWRLFESEQPRRIKPLLYVFRVLLTGIHLMRTGTIEANLSKLNSEFRLPYIPDLMASKLAGPEQSVLDDADIPYYESERVRLYRELEEAGRTSSLPEYPQGRDALNELLVRVRLRTQESR